MNLFFFFGRGRANTNSERSIVPLVPPPHCTPMKVKVVFEQSFRFINKNKLLMTFIQGS